MGGRRGLLAAAHRLCPEGRLLEQLHEPRQHSHLHHPLSAPLVEAQVEQKAEARLSDLVVRAGKELGEVPDGAGFLGGHEAHVLVEDTELAEEGENEHESVGSSAGEAVRERLDEVLLDHLPLDGDVLGEVDEEVESNEENLVLPACSDSLLHHVLNFPPSSVGRVHIRLLLGPKLGPLELELNDFHRHGSHCAERRRGMRRTTRRTTTTRQQQLHKYKYGKFWCEGTSVSATDDIPSARSPLESYEKIRNPLVLSTHPCSWLESSASP